MTTADIPQAGVSVAQYISQRLLKVARPFFWHPGAPNGDVLAGATAFVLQTERGYIGVTADHVVEAYLNARGANPALICQLGLAQAWPEEAIIARSRELDIATFKVGWLQVQKMDGEALDCRGHWPPPVIAEGDTISYAGFLDTQRERMSLQEYVLGAHGGHGVADSITDREIMTTYDSKRELALPGIPKPPLGLNMSGCSGAPVVVARKVEGKLRLLPVGLVYKGPSGAAQGDLATIDRLHIRRIHFVQADGTIKEPDQGWLPSR